MESGRNLASLSHDKKGSMLARLCRAREVVAALVIEDSVYLPIFERLETEVAIEEAKASAHDALSRARAIAAAKSRQLTGT